MNVRVQDQAEGAKVERDEDGGLTLCLRPGLVSSSAFVAIILALGTVTEQEYAA